MEPFIDDMPAMSHRYDTMPSQDLINMQQAQIQNLLTQNQLLLNQKWQGYLSAYDTDVQKWRSMDYLDHLKHNLEDMAWHSGASLQERMAYIGGVEDLNGHMWREIKMRHQERKLKKMKWKRKKMMAIIEQDPPHHYNGPYPPGFHPWTEKVWDPYGDAKNFKNSKDVKH